MLANCVKKEEKLLEIGVGGGNFIKLLSNKEVYGIDVSLAMSKRAKFYSTKVCQATAKQLPFKEKLFDVVVFSYTLGVIKEKEKSIEEAKRVGKKVMVLDFLPLPLIFEWIGKIVFQAERIKLINFKLKKQKLWFGIWSTM
jgi:ubiquinone/menaquinone biosynthesis C-methylase UbiE